MTSDRHYKPRRVKPRPGGPTKRKELTPEQIFILNELYWEKNLSRYDTRCIAQVGEGVMDRHLLRWSDWVKFKNEFIEQVNEEIRKCESTQLKLEPSKGEQK